MLKLLLLSSLALALAACGGQAEKTAIPKTDANGDLRYGDLVFKPCALGGDHGDYVHLFINKTARRMIIRRMRMRQGDGFPLMGLFLQSKVAGAEFAGMDIEDVLISTSNGQGVIVGAEGRGSEARVQVNFRGHGVKWLALQYAKLTPG